MKHIGIVITLFLLIGCSGEEKSEGSEKPNSKQTGTQVKQESAEAVETAMPEWNQFFENRGVTGCVVVLDLQKNQLMVNDHERAQQAFMPASTFKIFNSLVAVETGVAADGDAVFDWDGVERDFEVWNQDLTLAQAIEHSAVWVYQEIARKVGENQMQTWINAVGYGNEDISGGIDKFWLEGGLRISAYEQIDFLERFAKKELPFTSGAMDVVKDIMIREQTADYTLRAKTGWAIRVENQIGWYVGMLDQGDDQYVFAVNIDINDPSQLKDRLNIAFDALHSLGLMTADPSDLANTEAVEASNGLMELELDELEVYENSKHYAQHGRKPSGETNAWVVTKKREAASHGWIPIWNDRAESYDLVKNEEERAKQIVRWSNEYQYLDAGDKKLVVLDYPKAENPYYHLGVEKSRSNNVINYYSFRVHMETFVLDPITW